MFNRRQKKRQEILERQKNVKEDYFDFERISLFFSHENHSGAHQVIDNKTLNDLDFEELFISLDRTVSVVGQQYLYSKLRVIPSDTDQPKVYEEYIRSLDRNPKHREFAIFELNKLNGPGAYYLQRLFFGKNIEKPKWFWLLPILSILALVSMLVAIFHPPILLLALLFISLNTLIHFWNKNNLLGYANSIPQLLKLHKVASDLANNRLFIKSKEQVDEAIRELSKIRRSAIFFKWESKSLDELSQVGEYLLDLIKGAFLIEPIVFFRLLKQIDSNKKEIKTIYEAVGLLDISISISFWRESLPHYCIPEFQKKTTRFWHSEGIYHPLIEKPESNDLSVKNEKSILLSGSNMSGKTTFIRTIGINALLAQTINTACAHSFNISRYKIYSAIRITDNLIDSTSYYYEEVKTIKKIVDESQCTHFNLFLLDEMFKGTNTMERIASGKAVLSYLNGQRNLVCCSTHDLELIDYLKNEYENFHFTETIKNDQLLFDYKLKRGSLNNTNAIRILELNYFPTEITDEAKCLVEEIAKTKEIFVSTKQLPNDI